MCQGGAVGTGPSTPKYDALRPAGDLGPHDRHTLFERLLLLLAHILKYSDTGTRNHRSSIRTVVILFILSLCLFLMQLVLCVRLRRSAGLFSSIRSFLAHSHR